MATQVENLRKLKDGREFWTTGNGFNYHAKDKKGNEYPIGKEYYDKMVALFKKENKFSKTRGWIPRHPTC